MNARLTDTVFKEIIETLLKPGACVINTIPC